VSILIVGLGDEVLNPLVRRLIAQGDEVRVMAGEQVDPDAARQLGAFIASGPNEDDPDLYERAAQNVRTVVVGPLAREPAMFTAIVEGTGLAQVGRIVYVHHAPPETFVAMIAEARFERIVLRPPRPRSFGRRRLDPVAIAEAIDAADDLAGPAELDLDLAQDAAWRALKLDPPLR